MVPRELLLSELFCARTFRSANFWPANSLIRELFNYGALLRPNCWAAELFSGKKIYKDTACTGAILYELLNMPMVVLN